MLLTMTEQTPVRFEDTDVTPNFSENRDRCLTHFYLEPSM